MNFAEDSEVKYIGQLPSYYANGVAYTDVKVFENLIAAHTNLPRKLYFARGVGIIRKELFNGQNWELRRYHINR